MNGQIIAENTTFCCALILRGGASDISRLCISTSTKCIFMQGGDILALYDCESRIGTEIHF